MVLYIRHISLSYIQSATLERLRAPHKNGRLSVESELALSDIILGWTNSESLSDEAEPVDPLNFCLSLDISLVPK